jgi:Carboxypeptidase regulatory-like domain/TonB dependent receptor-like, beta-barrel
MIPHFIVECSMRFKSPHGLLARIISLVAVATFAWSGSLLAQGVTSGSVRGRVTSAAGGPVVGAEVTLTNTQTGFRYQATSRDGGRFDIENVTPGGPFTLAARIIGYRPTQQSGIQVSLGQVVEVNLQMASAAVQLSAVTVSAGAENPLTSTSRTGASSFITDSMISNLPSLGRNFTDLMATSPLVNGGSYPSIAGQNNRYNNIQIDGGVNNDLFGLGSTGTPGGQVGEIPISLEAVKEFQILIAPFDVRQGGFTGGLVNAVTKSGTNEFHGSVYFYGQNQNFGRKTVDYGTSWNGANLGTDVLTQFSQYQYGGTVGGPVIKDRLLFFAAADFRSHQTPFGGYLQGVTAPGAASDSIDIGKYGVTAAQADSVTTWATNNLKANPGSAGQVQDQNPDHNIFVKLNGEVSPTNHVELSYNHVTASDGSLLRGYSFSGYRNGYEMGDAGYSINNASQTARLRYNAAIGNKYTNELMLGYQNVQDLRNPTMNTPLIFVGGNGGAISIGAERYSQGNVLKQRIYEVTDNLTIALNGGHLLTVGTHNEFFNFYNQFFPGSYGVWYFPNAAALYASAPSHYEIALPLRPNGPLAQFSVNQLGLYIQDIWSVTPRFKLTYGLRVDDPLLPDKPGANASLANVAFVHYKDDGSLTVSDTAHANTSGFSTAPLWSPRLGFNYDVAGDQSTIFRGGLGVFSGRPPYVWVSNAYANSGLTQATLSCNGASVPTFSASISSQPTLCAAGGPPSPPTPSIVYFDHNFSFPQTMRAALGSDHKLPWDMVGSVDLLYTQTINQFYLNDVNLKGVISVDKAEGGRLMYGTVNPSNGFTTPARITNVANDVIRQYNSSGDHSWSATVSVDKRFSDHVSFNAGYTYSQTKDRMCMTSSISSSNFRYAVLQGPLDNRPLSTSCFDVPNHLVATVLFDAPLGLKASLTYSGNSGLPFTYINNYDANGDGWGGNDPIYVPLATDTTYIRGAADRSQFNAFIDRQPCLASQRGQIMARNSCRNPWMNFLNARVAKSIPTINGHALQISLDIFNLPNLISSHWLQNKETCSYEGCAVANIVGQAPSGESINTINSSGVNYLNAIVPSQNRYRLLLSATYSF